MIDWDKSSTEAMVWAEAFCATAKEQNWTLEDIDEDLLATWFVNYWVAVHDPLHKRIKELEQQLSAAQQEVGDE